MWILFHYVDIFSQITKFIKITRIIRHSCYRDAWKSTVYNVKTVSTDISGNIHRKCPIFFLTSIYQTGWLPKQFIIVRSPDHLVLIPGGFYYWRDASSTMVHHCQRADFKESSKLARVPNRNGASQPYETFWTLTMFWFFLWLENQTILLIMQYNFCFAFGNVFYLTNWLFKVL